MLEGQGCDAVGREGLLANGCYGCVLLWCRDCRLKYQDLFHCVS